MSMAGGRDVGIRLMMIGRDGMLAGYRELSAGQAKYNAAIMEGAAAAKRDAVAQGESTAAVRTHIRALEVYETQMGVVQAETASLARVGKTAFLGLTAATVAWSVESIRWAQQYQTQLLLLHTQANQTVGDMNRIGAAAKANSAALGISATQYVMAAYHPASVGMRLPEIKAITEYGAKAAQIAGPGTNVEETTNALTTFMRAYDFGANKAGKTAATLNAIVGQGNMRYGQLVTSLQSGIAATSKLYGVTPVGMGAALARLTDIGMAPAQAGTRLRMAETILGAPTNEAAKLLGDIGLNKQSSQNAQSAMAQLLQASGVTTTQLSYAMQKSGTLSAPLELLHKALAGSGMDKEMQDALIGRAFGGGRMGTSLMTLYSQIPKLQQKESQIGAASNPKKFNEDWIATTKTLRFQLHALGAEVENLGISFGTKLLPYVSKAAGVTTDFLKFLGAHKGVVLALAGVITAVLVPAIGVYLYRALLGNGSAIRGVLGAYRRLILGQSEEEAALIRYNAALEVNDAALAQNAGMNRADAAAAGLNGRAAIVAGGEERTGGLLGAGGLLKGGGALGVGGKLLGAAGLAAGGVIAGGMLRGNAGTNASHLTGMSAVRSVGGDMAEGAGIGAAVGSVVPGVGTVLGAGIGAAGGGLYAERSNIGHAVTSAWDDLFGSSGSSQSSAPASRNRLHVVAQVHLDGKHITSNTVKRVRQKAART